MSDTEQSDRVTRRDLAEGRLDKVASERTALVKVSDEIGGLHFENALQMADAAKLMATAGPMLPPWLQGNVGGCWGIIVRATELRISPMTLASMSYLVNNKGVEQVAYMSNFFRTIIEARAPIKEKALGVRYEGEGDKRKCIVWATFIGEDKPREWPLPGSGDEYTLGKLRPRRNDSGKIMGSPLWDTKPDQQLFYAMSRDWGRVYCSGLVAGIYSADELTEEETRFAAAKDVTPKIAQRLQGAVGRDGFAGSATIAKNIDAVIDAARSPLQPEITVSADASHRGRSAAAAPDQSSVPGAAAPAESHQPVGGVERRSANPAKATAPSTGT